MFGVGLAIGVMFGFLLGFMVAAFFGAVEDTDDMPEWVQKEID